MATPNYDINYNDKRFTEVKTEEKEALSDLEKTYGGMIKDSDKYYQAQIDASKQWADKQTALQQEQTDFAIEKIEQQKDQAYKDYTKEQSGAYIDWQKQSDPYGANAEKMAAAGLIGTGYGESSMVSMYNTYQNRVTAARESYNQAVLNYNNSIQEARLQNNSALAEIAYEALQQQLELSLQGFQYKNQLLLDKANQKRDIQKTYHTYYQDVLAQINQENAMDETVRMNNEELELKKRAQSLDEQQFAWQKAQAEANTTYSDKGGNNKSGNNESGNNTTYSDKGGNNKSGNNTSSSEKIPLVNTIQKKGKSYIEVDMDSVMALGFGPISPSKLNDLVKSGVIEEYKSGGKLKYRKTAKAIKQQMFAEQGLVGYANKLK